MKKIILVILLFSLLSVPVLALEDTAPEAPSHVQTLLPEDRDSFGEGLWYVIRSAFMMLQPDIAQSARTSLCVIAAALLLSVLQNFSSGATEAVRMVGIICVSALLLQPVDTWIAAAADTISQTSAYGKLLLPVITAALAAQGGTATSAALYTATIAFDAVLSGLISTLLVPMVYVYLVLAVVNSAVGNTAIQRLRDLIKGTMVWILKILLYVFTGYVSITGVVSGAADQTVVKAAKLTISSAIPVVGSILSDASEAVLVSAGLVKSTVGIGGMLVVIAITIVPFLQIGLQYLLLKLTAAVCSLISHKTVAELVDNFSGAMGLLLGMTGAVCMMFLISMVCFLRGMG